MVDDRSKWRRRSMVIFFSVGVIVIIIAGISSVVGNWVLDDEWFYNDSGSLRINSSTLEAFSERDFHLNIENSFSGDVVFNVSDYGGEDYVWVVRGGRMWVLGEKVI